MHATLFGPYNKLRLYRHCLGEVIGDGEVVGFGVTRAVGRHSYVPAGGVRGSAVPVLFHREVCLTVNFHKPPDAGQIIPGVHHETYHALELPVLLVVVVGTEEPAQDEVTVKAGTVIKTLAPCGSYPTAADERDMDCAINVNRSAWILPGSWTPLTSLCLS